MLPQILCQMLEEDGRLAQQGFSFKLPSGKREGGLRATLCKHHVICYSLTS